MVSQKCDHCTRPCLVIYVNCSFHPDGFSRPLRFVSSNWADLFIKYELGRPVHVRLGVGPFGNFKFVHELYGCDNKKLIHPLLREDLAFLHDE